MRITGLGHAGMFIETVGGNIICDPVLGPSFYGSWFPFPDNRGLDWERYGRDADFLWISHRHRDHFDPRLLERYIRKDIEVLLPEYPTDDLEKDIRALGYTNITYAPAGQVIQRGELKMMVTPLRAPSDGPIGDSSLSVDDGTGSVLNQNDSHPLDLEKLLDFGKPDAYFTQVSGAIWWPMVYDLPLDAKQNFARLKREAQNKRAMYYIEKVDAPHVFPMAGPPMFLRDDLFDFNGLGKNGESIFTDQKQFLAHMKELAPQYDGQLFIPGTVVTVEGGEVTSEQTLYTEAEIAHIFDEKWEYLEEQRASRQQEIRDEEASRAEIIPPAEMLAAIKEWWEPLLKKSRTIRLGVGGCVRFRIGELDMVVDFPAPRSASTRARSASTGTRSPPIWSRRTSSTTRSTGRTRSSSRCSSRWAAAASSTSSSPRSSSASRSTGSSTSRTGTRSRPTRRRTPRSATGSCSAAAPICAPTSPRPARSTRTASSRAACTTGSGT